MSEPGAGATRALRQAHERHQRRRSTGVAALSTAAVVGLLVWLVPQTSGWESVQQSFFSPDAFRDVFPELLGPFWYDVQIFLWCAPCIVAVGLLMAMARGVRTPALYPVRLFATVYIDVVRGVPVILWITLLGFGVPAILQTREWYGKGIVWGSVALIVAYSAYVAEVFRAGIESVHESQRAAARSLGLTSGQAMRAVVLPQAVRRVVPPLMNDMVSLQKDVALISVLGPVEALRRASIEVARTFNFTPVRRRRRAVPLRVDPADPAHRSPAAARARPHVDDGDPVKLQLQAVVKDFGDHRVLDGIDLDVGAGQVIALIGASGSGKSTLLRCVNLLEPIDDGRILLDGDDISAPGRDADPVRRRIGLVFQSFNLFPHLTVVENVGLAPRKVRGLSHAEARTLALGLLDRLGLAGKADDYPDRLSGGQQQRVAIARSLAMGPEVMLLDEITSALDPELVGEVLDVVRDLRLEGMTMLLATHEMSFAREISDRVCFLDDGRIVEEGPPAQVLGDPVHERTRRFLQRVIEAGRM